MLGENSRGRTVFERSKLFGWLNGKRTGRNCSANFDEKCESTRLFSATDVSNALPQIIHLKIKYYNRQRKHSSFHVKTYTAPTHWTQYWHTSDLHEQRCIARKKQSGCPCWTIYWFIGHQGPNPNPLNPISAGMVRGKIAEINQWGLQSERKGNKHTLEERRSVMLSSSSHSPSVCPGVCF